MSATDYYGGSDPDRKYLVTARYDYPDAVTSKTDASRVQTSYEYTFWSGTDDIQTRTTTWPSISSGENGSGSSNTAVEYYDTVGRQRWTKDELGYTTYYSYHPEHGDLAYTVRDCDPTSLPSSADSNSTKWVTSSDGSASSNKPTRGGGLATAIEAVSFSEFDSRGREELSATEDGTDGTVLSRHYTVYQADKTLRFPYWNTSTNKPRLPIEVAKVDGGGLLRETYSVDPDRTASSGGKPTGLSDGTGQSHYLSLDALRLRRRDGGADDGVALPRHSQLGRRDEGHQLRGKPGWPRRGGPAGAARRAGRHDHAHRVRHGGPRGEHLGGHGRRAHAAASGRRPTTAGPTW